jgi:hypothetical protein
MVKVGSQSIKLGAQGTVKRRRPQSARRDRQIARRSGRLGVPRRAGSRSEYDRDGVRIPGSVRVLPDQVAEWAADHLRDQPYVLYCT